jgi:predicted nuclease with TOPRIM domain
MSAVTENDLKELKELIIQKYEKIEDKLNDIRVEIATLKEGQNSINKRLDDLQSNLNKRIDNLDFIARTIIASVAVAFLVGLIKFLFFNVNI